MMGLVLQYLEEEVGGLVEMEKRNNEKAALLYDYLDSQSFFNNPVEKPFRSIMNVTFTSPSAELDKKFCKEAEQRGTCQPQGTSPCGRDAGFDLQRDAD